MEVIREGMIKEVPYLKVDDILSKVPGLNVVRNNGIYTIVPTATLRGLSDEQARTLILLDGIPLNKSDTGNVNLNRINVNEIERIEIFKGPASSIYGNNAMGGVINIITKKPEKTFDASFDAQAGTYGTYMGDVQVSGKIKKAFYRLAARTLNSDGYVSTPPERRTQYTVKRFAQENSCGLLVGYEPNDSNTIMFRADIYDDKRGEGTRIFHVNGVHRDFDTDAYSLSYRGRFGEKRIVANAFYSRENYRRVSETIRGRTYTRFDVDSDRVDRGLDISLSVPFGKSHLVTFGGDLREGSVDAKDIYRTSPDRTLNEGKLRLKGIFIQDETKLMGGKLNLLFGIRYDHAHFFDGSFFSTLPQFGALSGKIKSNTWEAISPKFAAKYVFSKELSAYASYGRGFRASILDDLCRSGIMWGLYKEANPFLKPEKIDTYEFGFDYNPRKDFVLSGSFYYSLGRDFLYYVPTGRSLAGRPLYRRENVGRIVSEGLELSVKYDPTKEFSLGLNWSLNHAEIKEFPIRPELEGQDLTRVPRYQLKGSLTYKGPHFNVSLLPLYKSSQWVYTNEMTQTVRRLKGYFLLDAKIWRKFGDRAVLSFDVFNLFNERYMESADDRAPGLMVMGRLRYEF